MDGNLSEMLQGVLSYPSAMEKIMGVAQNLMGSQGGEREAPSVPHKTNTVIRFPS